MLTKHNAFPAEAKPVLKATKHIIAFKKFLQFLKTQQEDPTKLGGFVMSPLKIMLFNAGPTLVLTNKETCDEHSQAFKFSFKKCELQQVQQMCFNKQFLQHFKPQLKTCLPGFKESTFKVLGSLHYAQVCSGELKTQNCAIEHITKSNLSNFAAQAALERFDLENLTKTSPTQAQVSKAGRPNKIGGFREKSQILQNRRFEFLGAVVILLGQVFFISSAELKQTLVLRKKTAKPEIVSLNACRRILLKSRCGASTLVKTQQRLKNFKS